MSPRSDQIGLFEEAAQNVELYIASSDRVTCKRHGWQDSIFTRNSKGIRIRLCLACFADIVPEISDPVKVEIFRPNACPTNLCHNYVLASNTCPNCKWDFCAACLPEGQVCPDCAKDTHDIEFQRV